MNNFKSDKFVEVLQEFLIVQGQNTYSIGSMSLSDVYFFVKKGNENYKVLATGQYQVVGTNLIINDASVITNNTNIQVCKVLNIVASKYISDIANINTLRNHYNTLVDDFIKIIDFLRKSGIKSDSSSMNYIFPLLEEGQVFMKKGLGFEGKQIMDIDAELQAQIDKAYAFFEQYVNNEKKPELDAYTVSKKQELETYTIAKKGEINTLVTGHKADINTLADTKKTEIIELGNLKQQEIISLSTGKIKEITDVTTVKKQEIETLTAQKKVQITDHTDLEIQKILSLGIDGLQAQIDANKSDILSKQTFENIQYINVSRGNGNVAKIGTSGVAGEYIFGGAVNDFTEFMSAYIRIGNDEKLQYTTASTPTSPDAKTRNIFHTGNCLMYKDPNYFWAKFITGMIVQFGNTQSAQVQNDTVTFPIPFSGESTYSVVAISNTASGNMTCNITQDNGSKGISFNYNQNMAKGIRWIAIGY